MRLLMNQGGAGGNGGAPLPPTTQQLQAKLDELRGKLEDVEKKGQDAKALQDRIDKLEGALAAKPAAPPPAAPAAPAPTEAPKNYGYWDRFWRGVL